MTLKNASLMPHTQAIVCQSHTEKPFSSTLSQTLEKETASYVCRACGIALFRSHSKFNSGTGWPSFDEAIPDRVHTQMDPDGFREEIRCARCQAHLGHVFFGEQFTNKNTRFCVNGESLEKVNSSDVDDTDEAIVAGGCFWGVDYFLRRIPGVLHVEVGYTGGHQAHPTYSAVCSHQTGHVEAVRVLFDTKKVNYTQVIKHFFEIHNPEQSNGQGPDIGSQYLSRIFYYDDTQKNQAQAVIQQLFALGYQVATQLLPVSIFWKAEDDHQQYYDAHRQTPTCHRFENRFKRSFD